MNPAVVGALLNSALYLLTVFVAGLVTGHPIAAKCAVAAFGVTYLAYHLMVVGWVDGRFKPAANILVALSIAIGAFAGLDLLF